jgi:CHAT domain-containing protein
MKTTFRKLAIAVVIHVLLLVPIHAEIGPDAVKAEHDAAAQSILQGRVTEGVGRFVALLNKIDPLTQTNDYFAAANTLADFLHQLGSYSEENRVLATLQGMNLVNTGSPLFQRMQLNIGRNLAFTGNAANAEPVLRTLTENNARLVNNPLQREAARVLSTIELDRGNVSQAALWMRRALVGVLIDQGSGSEEIADTLTQYALYLARTRQLAEASNLILRLTPVYDKFYPQRSPKYLHFCGVLLEILQSTGNFQAADRIYARLKELTGTVDVVSNDIRRQLFYQDFYGAALKSPASGDPVLASRLRQVSIEFPDYFKDPEPRITFAYFAALAGSLELAEQFATLPASDTPLTLRLSAYKSVLDAYFSASHQHFGEAIARIGKALEAMEAFHQTFATELASHLPSISIEERNVLGTILGLVSSHISSPAEANVVFQLEQFLNRDKSKLSLSDRVARQALRSDLEREDLRTRDRLKDLRERSMADITDRLITRTATYQAYAPRSGTDYALLTSLERIEETIANIDIELKESIPDLSKRRSSASIELTAVQRLLKPNEALIVHVTLAGIGIVSTCVSSDNAVFSLQQMSATEARQLVVDTKLVSAALRASHAPSRELDSDFPAENSFHLYQAMFGGIETCIMGKTHLLLATDADLLTLPWNAFLSALPATDSPFKFREAAWLPKRYSISLLPSVASLRQIRGNLPVSEARSKFLGIGDPDFAAAGRSTVASIPSLTTARGVANGEAIAQLPPLPDAAVELRDVADVLDVKQSELLLGGQATERNLRSRPLDDYKIISFATHAVIAGELEGGTEPALMLSPGADAKNTRNDGALTANEIADLTLDANLVILSACNTAAPDGRVAGRGLSGLADAFFFAGARAVVVTQWSVFSDAARQLGAGVVSQSISSDSIGVAEGLRMASLDYISSAKQDFLAHPRFWAGYIIAGDGAVNPLGRNQTVGAEHKDIKVAWEDLAQRAEQAEVMDITGTGLRNVNYAIGVELPPPGGRRAGSYVAKVDAKGTVEIGNRDAELAASRIVSLGSDLGVMGFYPNTCTTCPQSAGNTSAVFRLLDSKGRERWKYVQQSPQHIVAKSMLRNRNGFLLVAFSTDYSGQSRPSFLSLTQVSEAGIASKQSQITIPLKNPNMARGFVRGAKGEIIVAVTGVAEDSWPSNTPSIWVNPQTAAKHFQCRQDSSILLSIDPATLEVRRQSTIPSAKIRQLRQVSRQIFGTMNFSRNCQWETNVRLVEFDAGLQPKTLFESSSVNSVAIEDFAVTDKNFILVGILNTVLPPSLADKTVPLDELAKKLIPNLWDGSMWDTDIKAHAAVIVVGRDGRKRADRVFLDARNRELSAIAMRDPDRFVAVGRALGDVGWTVGITLGHQLK